MNGTRTADYVYALARGGKIMVTFTGLGRVSPRRPHATHEQSALRLAGRRALLHSREIAAAGIPTVVLPRLVRRGRLVKVNRVANVMRP